MVDIDDFHSGAHNLETFNEGHQTLTSESDHRTIFAHSEIIFNHICGQSDPVHRWLFYIYGVSARADYLAKYEI